MSAGGGDAWRCARSPHEIIVQRAGRRSIYGRMEHAAHAQPSLERYHNAHTRVASLLCRSSITPWHLVGSQHVGRRRRRPVCTKGIAQLTHEPEDRAQTRIVRHADGGGSVPDERLVEIGMLRGKALGPGLRARGAQGAAAHPGVQRVREWGATRPHPSSCSKAQSGHITRRAARAPLPPPRAPTPHGSLQPPARDHGCAQRALPSPLPRAPTPHGNL